MNAGIIHVLLQKANLYMIYLLHIPVKKRISAMLNKSARKRSKLPFLFIEFSL